MTIAWHRILGMALTRYFAGSAWKVEVEVDLSLQQQLLDLIILRHTGNAPEPLWPDGFGNRGGYNLLTFKAMKDPLDSWALDELAAHRVNYRKLISPDIDHLLPAEQFRMFAASMQFPRGLANQVTLQPCGPGTYDVQWGVNTIRVLVLREIPEAEQNLVWNLFSSDRKRIEAAFQQLQPQKRGWSSLINELLGYYGLEGLKMPYTEEDFEREVKEKILRKLTPEELLSQLSPEQRMHGLPPEEVFSQFPLEEIENYLKKKKTAQDKAKPEDDPH